MRKVTIVVPVLMTSCHVSLKWNRGPVTAHTTITPKAIAKAQGRPVQTAAALAKRANGPAGSRGAPWEAPGGAVLVAWTSLFRCEARFDVPRPDDDAGERAGRGRLGNATRGSVSCRPSCSAHPGGRMMSGDLLTPR